MHLALHQKMRRSINHFAKQKQLSSITKVDYQEKWESEKWEILGISFKTTTCYTFKGNKSQTKPKINSLYAQLSEQILTHYSPT